jgi:cysteine desulfurase
VIYFDHNATSPMIEAARATWLSAADRCPGNPSSPHRLGARADAALNEAREKAAGFLGCSPFDLVWNSGATEGSNSVLHHAAQDGEGEAWVSAIEHPCVLAAAARWFGERVRQIPVTEAGQIELNWLEDRLRKARPALVAVMAVNNETGILQPWAEALDLCRQHGAPMLCDAAQWIGKLPASSLGRCDFVLGCAHKFGGAPGVGFMKVPSGFKPLIVGGPQEDGRRAGTENVPGILAMASAWEQREQQLARGEAADRKLRRESFIESLTARVPGVEVPGRRSPGVWNTVTALMPRTADCRRRWVVQLDKLGFAVSTGSACASGKEKPSHVLTAMGVAPDESDRMLRFSAGWETAPEEWDELLKGIEAAFEELSRLGRG